MSLEILWYIGAFLDRYLHIFLLLSMDCSLNTKDQASRKKTFTRQNNLVTYKKRYVESVNGS